MKVPTLSTIEVGPRPLTIEQVVELAQGRSQVALSNDGAWRRRVKAGRDHLVARAGRAEVVYGVTTGVGDSCDNVVPVELAAEMQLNLLRFHGCGTGRLLTEEETAAVLAARLASLCSGWSAVRELLLQRLCDLLNHRLLPCIPSEGSVGASGDLTQDPQITSVKTTFVHVVTSIGMMLVFHGAYKQVNGLITGREPAYLYATGLHLLAFWAPILEPTDATDERLAQIIAEGEEFDIKELTERNNQRFKSGYLVDRWQEAEPDVPRANRIAKETALRALRRNPLAVLRLAARTFAQYWNVKGIQHYATIDLGHHDLTAEQCAMLAQEFHFATDGRIIEAPPTLLQRFFLLSWPYCYLLMLSPLFGALAVYSARDKRLALLLLLHLVILLSVTFTFAVAPSLRYLQPASVLMLLTIALCLRGFLDSRPPEELSLSQ